jgi:hypothetical protein
MTTVHRWRAFGVLAIDYFMTIVDLTIVNVALPTIGHDLNFPESDRQWVVTAYGRTFGGFIPISVAGLAGVAEGQAGVAWGLLNTAQQIGAALSVPVALLVPRAGVDTGEANTGVRDARRAGSIA